MSGNARISKRQDRRPSTPSRLPPINPTSVINSDRRGTKKTNNEFNLNPSRALPDIKRETTVATTRITKESSKTFNPRHSVLPDIKSHTKAATTSRRTSCHQTIGDCNSQQDEPEPDKLPVIDTPRPAAPVDYSFKTLLSLDPDRKVPSHIPVLTGDISKLIPPRAPVYPHPLRYFAGELIEKEYQRAEMLKSAKRPSTNTSACQALSPRRPLDAFEQTMSELKRPSSAYSKLSFSPSHSERASAKPKREEESLPNQPHLHIITSRPKMTRKTDTSKADWWIKELEICRQTCQALHKKVPGCTSTVSCSGDLQMTGNVDTTNAEQVHTRFLRAMKLYFAQKMSLQLRRIKLINNVCMEYRVMRNIDFITLVFEIIISIFIQFRI